MRAEWTPGSNPDAGTHFAIEDVAARAGVSKTTIYRRYPSKISLVVAAAAHYREVPHSKYDKGSFRGDLIAITNLAGDLLGGSIWARILPGVLADAAREIRPETDPELMFELSGGPILVRLLVTDLPCERVWVEQLVDQILEGVDVGQR